jgi:DNA polymerase elongation subunit (family B)
MVSSKSLAKTLSDFFQNDEYLNLASKGIVPAVRSFEAALTFDSHYRFQHDIHYGHCYHTNNYTPMTFAEITATFTHPLNTIKDAIYIHLKQDYIARYKNDPGCKTKIPLSLGECTQEPFTNCKPVKIGFDIEANNPVDKLVGSVFPTAKWTSATYAKRYKSILTKEDSDIISNIRNVINARTELINKLATVEKYRKICSEIFPKDLPYNDSQSEKTSSSSSSPSYSSFSIKKRKEFLDKNVVPNIRDTDSISVIAFVVRQKEGGDAIRSELGAFVYTWKPPKSIIKSPSVIPNNILKKETSEISHLKKSAMMMTTTTTTTSTTTDQMDIEQNIYNSDTSKARTSSGLCLDNTKIPITRNLNTSLKSPFMPSQTSIINGIKSGDFSHAPQSEQFRPLLNAGHVIKPKLLKPLTIKCVTPMIPPTSPLLSKPKQTLKPAMIVPSSSSLLSSSSSSSSLLTEPAHEQKHIPGLPIKFKNITDNEYFDNAKTHVFDSEYEMIRETLKNFKQICPDFITGHNIMSFDLPYLIDRMNELAEANKTINDELTSSPFSFGIIKGHKSNYHSYAFNRNNAQKTSWIVESPGMNFFDSCNAFKHETFGKKSDGGYKLANLMPKWLVYPGSGEKMRKLEIDIIKSSKLWYNGGDGLSYFVGYCLFDALGSVMLSELLSFFVSAFFIADASGATPASIYLRGVQNIIISMFHKTIWSISKIYLFPDYGTRELHFLDLWYWHYNSGYTIVKMKDGRERKKFNSYQDVRLLYETIPTLRRKWRMGGLRLIPDLREKKEKSEINPYLPKPDTPEHLYCCYSVYEIEQKKKQNIIPKSKAYMGAHVFEVFRGYFGRTFIVTFDKLSMYPTIAVSFCLDFCNMVTEFTKKIFKISRLSLIRVILGPTSIIQVGDVFRDKKAARERGFMDTDELVYVWYYQDSRPEKSIFSNMIRYLLASRKIAKNKMSSWQFEIGRIKMCIKLTTFLLENLSTSNSIDTLNIILDKLKVIRGISADAKGQETVMSLGGEKYFDEVLKIGNVISESSDLCSNDMWAKPTSSGRSPDDVVALRPSSNKEQIQSKLLLTFVNTVIFSCRNEQTGLIYFDIETYGFKSIQDIANENYTKTQTFKKNYEEFLQSLNKHLRRANVEESIANTDQLSKKLVMNSGYGGVSMSSGILPQIQLGSAITALGRELIVRASRIIENSDLIEVIKKSGAQDEIESIIGKKLDQIREKNGVSNIYNCVVTNGDTDSTIAALRDEVCPCPEALKPVQKKICPYIANEVNEFLPKKLINKEIPPLKSTKNEKTGEFILCITEDREKDAMNNEFEKTSIATVNGKKKNYIQMTIEEKEQFKGVASKKSDTLPYVAKLEKDATAKYILKPLDKSKNERTNTRSIDLARFLRSELLKLFRGDYNPADFRMKMRLNKPIEAYKFKKGKKPPTHVQVAIKKVERNEEVNVGDCISYVYIINTQENYSSSSSSSSNCSSSNSSSSLFSETKIKKLTEYLEYSMREEDELQKQFNEMTPGKIMKKNKQMDDTFLKLCSKMITHISYKQISDSKNVEDADYALKNNIPLDMLYYLEYKILPKLTTLIAPLLHSYLDYPRCPFGVPSREKKAIKANQKKIEIEQASNAYDVLTTGDVKEQLDILQTYRLQRQLIQRTKDLGITYIPDTPLQRCIHCNLFYSKPITLNDPMMIFNFLEESKKEPGFYGICDSCKSKNSNDEVVIHYKNKIKDTKSKMDECESKCWKCIKNIKVSIMESKIHLKNSLPPEELYFTKPSDCTMEDCDIFKEKKLHQYNMVISKQRLNLLEKLKFANYSW